MDWAEEARKPKFWIQDYWNAWLGPSLALMFVEREKSDENIRKLRDGKIPTFGEFVSAPKREYDGGRCDLTIIPERFIHQIDRLVRIYNSFLAEENNAFVKLRRTIDLAYKVVHKGYSIEN